MRSAALGLALTVQLTAELVGQTAAPETPAPFVVGVWGQKDAILPFADFDGRRWRSQWSAVKPDSIGLPLPSLELIPRAWWGSAARPDAWEVLEPDGGRQLVQPTGTRWAGLGGSCSSNVALSVGPPARPYQYGRVLATTVPGILNLVETVTPDSADWRRISGQVPGLHRRLEPREWWNKPYVVWPGVVAPRPVPKLDAAFLFGDASGQFIYLESLREINQLGLVLLKGWLWRQSSESPLQIVSMRFGTTDGDGKGEDRFVPLGVVSQGSRRFWIGELSGYAYAAMTVIEVGRRGVTSRVLVEYPGC